MARQMNMSERTCAATRLACLILLAACLWGCQSTATKNGGEGTSALVSLSTHERNKYDEALEHLASARPGEAEQQLAQLARARPDVAEIWLNLALSQYHQDDLEQTQKTLAVLLSGSDGHPQAHNLAGLVAVKTGEFQEAVAHYSKAIDLKPDYSHALYNMALLHDVYLQDVASAVAFYERYLLLAPDDSDTKNWAQGLKMSLDR